MKIGFVISSCYENVVRYYIMLADTLLFYEFKTVYICTYNFMISHLNCVAWFQIVSLIFCEKKTTLNLTGLT